MGEAGIGSVVLSSTVEVLKKNVFTRHFWP